MKDVKFMSAKEKELVLKSWITFIKNGFQSKHFTERLYNHLTLHASFICHYDRCGFYQTYFSKPEDISRFLKQFDCDAGCYSVEYGGTSWLNDEEYGDINKSMAEAIEPYKKQIYERCKMVERQRDLARALVLLGKHGIKFKEVK